jgi:hypothetical protein
MQVIFEKFQMFLIIPGIAPDVPAVYSVGVGIKGLCEAKTARPNVGGF